jgi:hypothetical protein
MPFSCLLWLELELAVAPALVDWVTCMLLLFEFESFDACCGYSPILF